MCNQRAITLKKSDNRHHHTNSACVKCTWMEFMSTYMKMIFGVDEN